MNLVISAYFHPFRMLLIDEYGKIVVAYYPETDLQNKYGFYAMPFEKLVDGLLAKNINISKIEKVLFLGKPLFFLEGFVLDNIRYPSPKKAIRFGKGISFYLSSILRMKRYIGSVLRYNPEFYFLSSIESFASIPSFTGCKKDCFFWNIPMELASSMLLKNETEEIVFFGKRLKSKIYKYRSLKSVKDRQVFIENVLKQIQFHDGIIFSDVPMTRSVQSNIIYQNDIYTLALAAMYYRYLINENLNIVGKEFENNFEFSRFDNNENWARFEVSVLYVS